MPPSVRPFEWIVDSIPRYRSFFTVDEHRERDRRLAEAHDHVTYEDLGESTAGEPLWAVTVGEGDRTALLLGAAHPNEPIGSMTIDFLVHELATNDDLRSSLDYEFVCVPVADPDGVRLNEGWFDGPFTLANYALNCYRPPPDQQVHATFPVDHAGYTFDDPLPATRALAELIDARKPEFVYDFHNTAFGGCYYYVTEDLAPLADVLTAIPGDHGVPLDRGEPERFDEDAFADAVYRAPTFLDQFEKAHGDDADLDEALLGGSAYDYASRFGDVTEVIVELPYFYEPRIDDRTELDRTREDVIREGVERRQALVDEIQPTVESVAEHLPDTPMAREVTGVFSYFEDEYSRKVEWAKSVEETNRSATVAQRTDEYFLRQYHLLPYVGMLLRSIDHAAMSSEEDTRELLSEAKDTVESVFHERIGTLLDSLSYETIPIRNLVAVQARAGLVCLDYHQNRLRK